ncbi:MAG: 2-C-methyl-D-erythritol 4-phosphate cytidylyltransferase [Desulfobacteraceae bacterium]|nr:MAG: 2-C-methyl-D-erythritol 4-phosphate cytidylyltransferase [Desulfobacteraceae bacterium]
MTVSAIIVAGGRGVRMGEPVRKQYLMLRDRPILSHTLQVFTTNEDCDHVILVIPPGDFEYCKTAVLSRVDHAEKIKMVPGGAERQDSVFCGLEAVDEESGIVLIHDAVRPFVKKEQIRDLIACAIKTGACILGISAFDTLKKVDQRGCISRTVDRSGIYLAQTPQAFQFPLIKKAHDMARSRKFLGTDDASLVEQIGHDVFMIQGGRDNIKITTAEDLKIAEAIMSPACREI